jgi:hypothetical protein
VRAQDGHCFAFSMEYVSVGVKRNLTESALADILSDTLNVILMLNVILPK